jgi:hypothetical protein
VLTKETSIVLMPAALLYVLLTHRGRIGQSRRSVWFLACLVPMGLLGGWFWFHVQATGWLSAPDNLGWLRVPAGNGGGELLFNYVPRMLFSGDGVLPTLVYLGVGYFVARFFIGVLSLLIVIHSLSPQSWGASFSRTEVARRLRGAHVSAWGGWGNIALLGTPILLQLLLMSMTISLHRYLLPEYTLFFVAAGKALVEVVRDSRLVVLASAFVIALFIVGWSDRAMGSSLPSPSSSAYLDFVDVDRAASTFLEDNYADKTILVGWPQYVQLAMPEQGYVHAPLHILAPIGTLARHEARLRGLGQRFFVDLQVDKLTRDDFDLVYYSARGHPPHVALLAHIIERFHLSPIAEFSKNADYVAIYGSR